jgi:hypothetical protein
MVAAGRELGTIHQKCLGMCCANYNLSPSLAFPYFSFSLSPSIYLSFFLSLFLSLSLSLSLSLHISFLSCSCFLLICTTIAAHGVHLAVADVLYKTQNTTEVCFCRGNIVIVKGGQRLFFWGCACAFRWSAMIFFTCAISNLPVRNTAYLDPAPLLPNPHNHRQNFYRNVDLCRKSR